MPDEIELTGNVVWVLSWKYSDGSAYGIINVYSKRDTAKREMNTLAVHGNGMKVFIVEPILVVQD